MKRAFSTGFRAMRRQMKVKNMKFLQSMPLFEPVFVMKTTTLVNKYDTDLIDTALEEIEDEDEDGR